MKIQVATTDRFRKAFRSFREKEQKQIDEGINTFLKDPTNPSSNFEPLNFIDHKLKSIRISDTIRVILALFDDVYFLLHVDYHDKAYAWGEKKRIDRNMISGAIQIYTDAEEVEAIGYETSIGTEKSPIFNQCSSEQLKIIGVPEGWIEKIKTVENEDDYTDLWSYLPDDTIENLEAVRNGFDIRNLVQQIQDVNTIENKTIVEQIDKQKGFELLTEDESLAEVLSKDISVFRFYLHPTQKFLVENDFNGPVKLTGTAGTGKTVVALHKTKKLVENLKDGVKPVLFTTYTKYLIKNIQSMFEADGISAEKLVVTNLHHFAVEYAKELELINGNPIIIFTDKNKLEQWNKYCSTYFIADYSAEFLMDEYQKIIQDKHILNEEDYLRVQRIGRSELLGKNQRKEVWKALSNFENFQRSENTFSFDDIIFQLNKYLEQWHDLKPFSHVICDEIQDFSNLELRLLRSLVPEGKNDMFLSGDPFQNIYQKKINFSSSNVLIRGRSFKLRTNYRTTAEIQKLAFKAIEDQEFYDFTGSVATLTKCYSLIYGEEPKQLVFENQQKEFEYLGQYIKDNFGTIGLHEICFATRKKDDREALKVFFKNLHYPCINLEEIDDLKETEGKIVLSTLHGLKGLEFKNLVVFNLSDDTFPFIPRGYNNFKEEKKKEYTLSEYALLYVAFSRAISNLLITGIGNKLDL